MASSTRCTYRNRTGTPSSGTSRGSWPRRGRRGARGRRCITRKPRPIRGRSANGPGPTASRSPTASGYPRKSSNSSALRATEPLLRAPLPAGVARPLEPLSKTRGALHAPRDRLLDHGSRPDHLRGVLGAGEGGVEQFPGEDSRRVLRKQHVHASELRPLGAVDGDRVCGDDVAELCEWDLAYPWPVGERGQKPPLSSDHDGGVAVEQPQPVVVSRDEEGLSGEPLPEPSPHVRLEERADPLIPRAHPVRAVPVGTQKLLGLGEFQRAPAVSRRARVMHFSYDRQKYPRQLLGRDGGEITLGLRREEREGRLGLAPPDSVGEPADVGTETPGRREFGDRVHAAPAQPF